MGDLRRERDSARTERDQLRQENQNLRAIIGDIAPEYADAYATLCDIALNGTRLDNPKTTGAYESQPPRHNPPIYDLRSEERRHQRRRADTIRSKLAKLGYETRLKPHPTLVGSTNTTPLAQPSQNQASVRTNMLDYRVKFRRAPQSAPQTESA